MRIENTIAFGAGLAMSVAMACSSPAWAAGATLSLDAVSGQAGTTVDIPIQFNPGTNAVSAIQMNLLLPTAVTAVSATGGSAANAAGKSVSTNVSGTTWTFLIFGLNQTAIGAGTLATARVTIAPGTLDGNLIIAVANPVFVDPNGVSIPSGSNTNGVLTVGSGSGSPGTPSLAMPDLGAVQSIPADGTLTLANADSYAGTISFSWSIEPAPTSMDRHAVIAQAQTASFTAGATASLANRHLTPGAYVVSVYAFDTTHPSIKSAMASKAVTLVASDLSAVQVRPNPWRRDRHDGKPVLFSQLPLNATVKIFTVSGHEVRTLTASNDSANWDRKTNSGDTVASGLYIYLITSAQGDTIKGKLAIVH